MSDRIGHLIVISVCGPRCRLARWEGLVDPEVVVIVGASVRCLIECPSAPLRDSVVRLLGVAVGGDLEIGGSGSARSELSDHLPAPERLLALN